MTIGSAIDQGISIDVDLANKQSQKLASYLEGWRERVLQESDVPGAVHSALHFSGIRCRKIPPSEMTDSFPRYLLSRQLQGGSWVSIANRTPMASSTFQYMQQAAGMVRMMLHAEPLEASALELETLNADILEDGPKFRYESPQRPVRHICFGLARRRSPN